MRKLMAKRADAVELVVVRQLVGAGVNVYNGVVKLEISDGMIGTARQSEHVDVYKRQALQMSQRW